MSIPSFYHPSLTSCSSCVGGISLLLLGLLLYPPELLAPLLSPPLFLCSTISWVTASSPRNRAAASSLLAVKSTGLQRSSRKPASIILSGWLELESLKRIIRRGSTPCKLDESVHRFKLCHTRGFEHPKARHNLLLQGVKKRVILPWKTYLPPSVLQPKRIFWRSFSSSPMSHSS